MSWIAVAIVGGSVVSGMLGADAATSAADTQAGAARDATAAQRAMFDKTEANVAPWLEAGQSSLKDLMAGIQPGGQFDQTPYAPFTMDKFHSDPGYQFQLQEGQNALENKWSKTGGPNSNNMKGLIQFSQGLANTDYQQALNNYITQFQLGNQTKQQEFANIAGISAGGLGAALQEGQIGTNVGQSIGSNIIGAGNASAAGMVGAANAWTGAASNGYNQYLQQQYLQALNPGGGLGYDPNAYMGSLQAQAALPGA